MDDIPEVYFLETIEQLRVLAQNLRLRILDPLIKRPMTAKQLAIELGEPPQKVHYHVRELEAVGLVRLVETREKGGILEKYYRAVARGYEIPKELVRGASGAQAVSEIEQMAYRVANGFIRAITTPGSEQSNRVAMSETSLQLTRDEANALSEWLDALVAELSRSDSQPGPPDRNAPEERRVYTLATFLYPRLPDEEPAPSAAEDEAAKSEPETGPGSD